MHNLTVKHKQEIFNEVIDNIVDSYAERMTSGCEGMVRAEEVDYIFACKTIIADALNIKSIANDSFFHIEPIGDFFLEQHSNIERLKYCMQATTLSDDYPKFLKMWNEGSFGDIIDYTMAEIKAHTARDNGGCFISAYATYVLELMIKVSIERLHRDEAEVNNFDALMFNANVINVCTELLKQFSLDKVTEYC